MDKIEKQRRKALQQEYTEQQQKQFENSLPMEREIFLELFDYLDTELFKNGCDDTNRLTKKFLTEKELKNVSEILEWLAEKGGYCDCEILANCEELFE